MGVQGFFSGLGKFQVLRQVKAKFEADGGGGLAYLRIKFHRGSNIT